VRALRRPSVTPPTLQDPRLADVSGALAAIPNPRSDDFPDRWWRAPDVLGALYAMHGNACAYCGIAFTRSDAGDVEHFRPKTLYPYLAYRFENYLLSCLYCNRRRKGDRFPLSGAAPPLPMADQQQLAAEPRLLVDPSLDPVEGWMTFDWNSQDIPMLVEAAPAGDHLPPPAVERVGETIKFFWLNRSRRLLRERLELLGDLLDAIDAGLREPVSRAASRFVPHGALARAIVAAARPNWLPTPHEEMQWLIDDLVKDLTLARRAGSLGHLIEPPAESTRWALAFLWSDPPAPVTAVDVEARLDHHHITAEILPLLQQLTMGLGDDP
jgi:uncharacterized protein (TIGR02646 family)